MNKSTPSPTFRRWQDKVDLSWIWTQKLKNHNSISQSILCYALTILLIHHHSKKEYIIYSIRLETSIPNSLIVRSFFAFIQGIISLIYLMSEDGIVVPYKLSRCAMEIHEMNRINRTDVPHILLSQWLA